MPAMSGGEALKKLREDKWGKTAKVIILTNLSDDESVRNSRELGALDYLIKTDWKLKEIVAKVKQNLAA